MKKNRKKDIGKKYIIRDYGECLSPFSIHIETEYNYTQTYIDFRNYNGSCRVVVNEKEIKEIIKVLRNSIKIKKEQENSIKIKKEQDFCKY